MMKLSNAAATAAVMLTVASLMSMPQAHAATSAANATGLCQGALPAFDTNIRKRPLGVANEGAANAFVSCSIPVGHNSTSVDDAVVFLTNRNAGPINVTCTFVDGAAAVIAAHYYPQTLSLAPGVFTPMIWLPADFALESFSPYGNFSCNLPPGVEMNVVGIDYSEDAP